MEKSWQKRVWIPQAISIPMLIWALYLDNPYGYYHLLRVIVCAVYAYLCFHAVVNKLYGWIWVLGVSTVIYNPMLSLHLTRGIWSVVNMVSILILGLSVNILKPYS